MATSTDLNWEENLISHWMSNTARAGVILNSAFPGLKTPRAISTESVSSGHGVNLVQRSSSISPSEDIMHKEQTLDLKSSFEEKLDSSKTLFSTAASNKEQTLMIKNVPAQWTATETKPGSDQLDDLDEGCCTELLLQKLEQVKNTKMTYVFILDRLKIFFLVKTGYIALSFCKGNFHEPTSLCVVMVSLLLPNLRRNVIVSFEFQSGIYQPVTNPYFLTCFNARILYNLQESGGTCA